MVDSLLIEILYCGTRWGLRFEPHRLNPTEPKFRFEGIHHLE